MTAVCLRCTSSIQVDLFWRVRRLPPFSLNTFLQLQETSERYSERCPVEIITQLQLQLHEVAFGRKRTRALLSGFCRVRLKPSSFFKDARNIWRPRQRGRLSSTIKCLPAPPQPTVRVRTPAANKRRDVVYRQECAHAGLCTGVAEPQRSIGSRCGAKT